MQDKTLHIQMQFIPLEMPLSKYIQKTNNVLCIGSFFGQYPAKLIYFCL